MHQNFSWGQRHFCCGCLTLFTKCFVWSCLGFCQTCAIWKPSLSLKQNQFGNMSTDTGHVFLKIKQEGILCFGITVAHPAQGLVYIWVQYSSCYWCLCATLSVYIDLNEACLSWPCTRAFTLKAFWEQGITLIWEHAVATMVTYLPRYGSSCYDFSFFQPTCEPGLAWTNSSLWLEFAKQKDTQELHLEIRQCFFLRISPKPWKQEGRVVW